MIVTHKKLTKAEMKRRKLSYDGWGKDLKSGVIDYYYVKKK